MDEPPRTTMPAQQVPWRMRADLQMTPLLSEGHAVWGVKDPVSLEYFELGDEACFVLKQLNGRRTIDEICQSFYERYRPRVLTPEELHSFVIQLIRQGLVISERPGSQKTIASLQDSASAQRRWSTVMNLLAIRFRGFDPDRLLGKMLDWFGWMLSPMAIASGVALILSAILLITAHFDELMSRLPDAQAFLNSRNLVWLLGLLAAVKVLHELGHGLACKRFGGECHELGLMLLVFTPTLYCDVTDIWMVRDKWKRIAVSLSGIWVELLIAAICTWLWWLSAPGLFHALCLNLIVVCGVDTLLFNGNPLLRYDGYFALADGLEIPNLRQEAISTVRSKLERLFCRSATVTTFERPWRRDWGLCAYGAAATIYRILLSILILWGLHRWISPYGFGVLVQCLAIVTLGSMILTPAVRAIQFLKSPTNRHRVKWFRVIAATGLLIAIGLIPWPYRVTAEATIDDDDAQRVYVTLAGTLIEGLKVGERVDAGQIIARLDEPRVALKLIQLEGDLNLQRSRLEQLERRRINEPQVAQSIPTVREIVHDLEHQLAQLQSDSERLILKSPCEGTVLPGPRQFDPASVGALPQWSGSPLDERNVGCYLREGTVVCLVGDPNCHSALVTIRQDDINLVHVGQRVRLIWNELAGEIVQGEIVELSGIDAHRLAAGGHGRINLPAHARELKRLSGTRYQARVRLINRNSTLVRNMSGQARIEVDSQSIVHRFLRWLKQTFPA